MPEPDILLVHLLVLALLPGARPVGIISPLGLVEELRASEHGYPAFAHEVSCIGRRFRPFKDYEMPIVRSPQLMRTWPADYRSLGRIGSVQGEGEPSPNMTTGRLLLAAPSQDPVSPFTLRTSNGCSGVLQESAEYGGHSMHGAICMVTRGGCSFTTKMQGCEAAGAAAVLIIQDPGGGPLMIGPRAEGYDDRGIGSLTVGYNFYEAVASHMPYVTVRDASLLPMSVASIGSTGSSRQ
jgi:hypothetical protein